MDKTNINTILIPDVHGRTFWKDALSYINEGITTVFLGDYCDPYSYEGVTKQGALENFSEIAEMAVNKPNVTLLAGNHDLSYINNMSVMADRYDRKRSKEWNALFKKLEVNNKLFMFKTLDINGKQFILSHAGMHPDWLDYVKNTYSYEMNQFNDFLRRSDHDFANSLKVVSMYRGGLYRFGSMVWADINEFKHIENENDYTTGKTQIVGHTQQLVKQYNDKGGFDWVGGEPCTIHTNHFDIACIDCHKCFYLDNEGNLNTL